MEDFLAGVVAVWILVGLVIVIAVVQAVILIFGLNGLFHVLGLEYYIPYTIESFCYTFLVILSLKGGGSTSKK